MAWFFHIIEQNDGRWACCYGWHEDDTHARLEDAIAHATQLTTPQNNQLRFAFTVRTAPSKACT